MNVKLKKILDFFVDIIFPPSCSVCGSGVKHGCEICGECRTKFIREMFVECPICSRHADKCECKALKNALFSDKNFTLGSRNSLSLTFYKNISDREDDRVTEKMIFALKQNKVLIDFFADLVSNSIKREFDASSEDISEWIVTYPPRSEENFIKYGYDHSEEIAVRIAQKLGIGFAKTLNRAKSLEQKNLDGSERRKNAENSLVLIRENVVNGGKYILFDDIMTTGATIDMSTRLLYFGGAAAVFPVTIAKTMTKIQKY